MGTKHKHYDVIVAWANGEEIQLELKGDWIDINEPDWYETVNYRIKPKRVKKEGWVNVYKATEHWHIGIAHTSHIGIAHTSNAYATKEEALADYRFDIAPSDTIRIEWEQEE